MNTVRQFLQNSTSRERGYLTKAITLKSDYRQDLQSEYEKIHNPSLSTAENFFLIANECEPVPCEVCGDKSAFLNFNKGYKRFCSQKCYTSTLDKKNPFQIGITVDGVSYRTIKEAKEATGLSYYHINKNVTKGVFESTGQIEKRVVESLRKKNPLLLEKELMLRLRKKKISCEQMAKELNVDRGAIFIALNYHKIDPKFDNLTEKGRKFISSEDELRKFVESGQPMSWAMKEHEIGDGRTIIKALETFNLEYVRKINSAEQHIIAELMKSFGFAVIINTRKIIAPLELDIYIPELKIAFEYNGIYWHSEEHIDNSKYHYNKYARCKEIGVRLYQIFEDDWFDKRDLIIAKIKNALGIASEKVFARKCKAEISSNKDVKEFYNTNHIQGYKTSKEVYVLKENDEIVAAMSFNNEKLERYATSKNVVGGFSKLLKFSKKERVMTYADLFWSDEDENVYTKNGFVKKGITRPGYYWLVNSRRERREKYQKYKLKDMPHYDDILTEREIMNLNGHYRIFDAGNAILEYRMNKD